MIRFAYQPFPVRNARTGAVETLHRPLISIVIHGPAGSQPVSALVDTGADDTLFPDVLIGPLGVAIRPGDQGVISGFDGAMTVARYGTVDLEISGPGAGYRWATRVGFYPGHRMVLGHAGFLGFFTATFNGRSLQLTLTPNGNAPAPAIPSP